MIVFKLLSKDGSNFSYGFSTVGMEGVLIINSDTFAAAIEKIPEAATAKKQKGI